MKVCSIRAVAMSTAPLFVTFWISPGHAQVAGSAAAAPRPAAEGFQREVGVPTASEAARSTDGDIVVTARRRNELLQDVPIAVSAISGDAAVRTGVTTTEALVVATPSLDFSRQSSIGATPFLRGVGTSQATAGVESPVAVYVDDVYIGSPNANLFSLNNIESVQVLKGPQGTLFGRNATGGVIQVRTKRPTFEPSGEARIGYGNYDTVESSFYATTGLSETVAVNIAASARKQYDGFGRSILTGRDTQKESTWDVRGQLLWNAGESTKLLLGVDHSDLRTDIGANSTVFPGTIGLGGATFAGEFNTQTAGTDLTKVRQTGVSLRVDQETSFADLVSISAYRYTKMRSVLDLDPSPIDFVAGDLNSPVRTFSQELQVVSKQDSAFNWIVGSYFYHADSRYEPFVISGLALAPLTATRVQDKQLLNSISFYGEGSYEVLPKTNLTLGVRYTKDFYTFDVDGRELLVGNTVVGVVPDTVFRKKDSFPKLTYRAILDYHFTPDVMGYASYSRGFKSGGFNLADPATASTAFAVRPEVLDAFEVGAKTRLFSGNLTFNVAGYYYKYKDLAVTNVNSGVVTIINAAAANIKGIDLDFVATPVRNLRIAGGLGVIDGEYTRFPNGPIFTQNPIFPFGNNAGSADLSGNRIARAPKFTASISPSYTLETSVGDFIAAGSFYHNSGFFADPSNGLRQPSYDLLGASLSWEGREPGLGVRVWVKNLTDARYFTYINAEASRSAINYAAPRTYGVTLTSRF